MAPLFDAADAATAALQAASGLHCPSGCGVCCETHNPEVTVLDMAPIAAACVADGTAEPVLARAATERICVFYEAGRLPGGCTQYDLRPLLCRLFAYAAVRDKHGQPELAVCHVHKAAQPDAVERARAYVTSGAPVAMFADLQAQADACDPPYARERMPINQALHRALARALLAQQFEAVQ